MGYKHLAPLGPELENGYRHLAPAGAGNLRAEWATNIWPRWGYKLSAPWRGTNRLKAVLQTQAAGAGNLRAEWATNIWPRWGYKLSAPWRGTTRLKAVLQTQAAGAGNLRQNGYRHLAPLGPGT